MSADAATTTPAANGNGNGTHVKEASDKKYNVEIAKMPGAHGKPDKAHHDAEMDRLKKEIGKVQAEVVSIKARERERLRSEPPSGQRDTHPAQSSSHYALVPDRTRCGAPSVEADPLPAHLKDSAGKSFVPSWTSYEVPRLE